MVVQVFVRKGRKLQLDREIETAPKPTVSPTEKIARCFGGGAGRQGMGGRRRQPLLRGY